MTMCDLPNELVEEILYRVPATSLKQLRSTCKQWNTLLKKNRRFTEKHFHEASKQSVVLMLKDRRVCPVSVNLNVAAPSVEVKGELSLKDSHLSLGQVDIASVFHCDGLLLCTTKDNRLVVWNPYLGETKWIPLKTDYKEDTMFALGYQNNKSCRIYKILRRWRCYEPNHKDVGFEIYDFSSDSWRVLIKNVCFEYVDMFLDCCVSLKGNTYWIVDYTTVPYFLLTFDFETERFKRLSLPGDIYDIHNRISLSVVREEQLSVLYYKNNTSQMEIWMTENINTEAALLWKKSSTVKRNIRSCYSVCMSSLTYEEKKVGVCCMVCQCSKDRSQTNNERWLYTVNIIGKDYEYSTEIPNEETFNEVDHEYCRWLSIFNYVPSLVQL